MHIFKGLSVGRVKTPMYETYVIYRYVLVYIYISPTFFLFCQVLGEW